VVLPMSWRSYVKATFFSGTLIIFGIGALTLGSVVAWSLGGAMAICGIVPFVDLIVSSRRWQLEGTELQMPRLWAPDRAVDITPGWRPGIDSVGRRDSIFPVETPTGSRLVHPNLLLARSDVRQWLHLIGQRQTARA
jgi:hypothetical protein